MLLENESSIIITDDLESSIVIVLSVNDNCGTNKILQVNNSVVKSNVHVVILFVMS